MIFQIKNSNLKFNKSNMIFRAGYLLFLFHSYFNFEIKHHICKKQSDSIIQTSFQFSIKSQHLIYIKFNIK